MKRFAVIAHDGKSDFPHDIHLLLRNYHWEQMDESHIIALCEIHVTHVDALENHAKVLLIPSLYSSQALGSHAARRNKQTHFVSLSNRLGVQEDQSALDLAERAQHCFGRKFALDV